MMLPWHDKLSPRDRMHCGGLLFCGVEVGGVHRVESLSNGLRADRQRQTTMSGKHHWLRAD